MEAGTTELEAVLESLGDVAFTVDGTGRYDLVTDALAALHDAAPEDLVGEESAVAERLREDEERWTAFRELVAGEREEMRLEMEFDRPGGGRMTVDIQLSRHAVDGEFDSVVVVGRDVTEDERRRTALEALHGVATTIQTEDTVEAVCERTVAAAEDVLEFTTCAVLIREEEWLVPYATSADTAEDGTRPMRVDEGGAGRTYRTGTTQVAEDFDADPDADPAKESYRSGLSIPVGDHGVFQAVSTAHGAFDETDVELAELLVSHAASALDRIERERDLLIYESIVEAVDEAVYVIDGDQRMEFVNQSYVDMKGVDRSEVLGTSIFQWANDDDVDHITEQVEELEQGERDVVTVDYDFQTVDGETIPVELRISMLTFPDGESGRVGIFRDISERKRYEQRLEERAEQLAILNRIVRHDISNDMTVVLEMTKFVQERLADEQLASSLDTVVESTRHTIELTRTARDLMETMLAQDREPEPVSLAPVLEAELSDLRASTDAEVRLDGQLPQGRVLADDLLASVFRNILTNAVRHNNAPDPEVVVSTEISDGSVRVQVADNGPGIPDHRKEEIFGKGEAGLESEGTGIGLYLVRTLVEGYGGSVRVEDREGGGSVFVVELELAPPGD